MNDGSKCGNHSRYVSVTLSMRGSYLFWFIYLFNREWTDEIYWGQLWFSFTSQSSRLFLETLKEAVGILGNTRQTSVETKFLFPAGSKFCPTVHFVSPIAWNQKGESVVMWSILPSVFSFFQRDLKNVCIIFVGFLCHSCPEWFM